MLRLVATTSRFSMTHYSTAASKSQDPKMSLTILQTLQVRNLTMTTLTKRKRRPKLEMNEVIYYKLKSNNKKSK